MLLTAILTTLALSAIYSIFEFKRTLKEGINQKINVEFSCKFNRPITKKEKVLVYITLYLSNIFIRFVVFFLPVLFIAYLLN